MSRLLILFSLGCSSPTATSADPPIERDCADGFDDDGDGDLDCRDADCAEHPSCDPSVSGPETVSTTSSSTTTPWTATDCPEDLCSLTSVDLEFRLDVTYDPLFSEIGLCDCYLTYAGDGVLYEYDPTEPRVTFAGSFVRTDEGPPETTTTGSQTAVFQACDPYATPAPCEAFISDGVWWQDGLTYLTFLFDQSPSGTELDQWIAHPEPTGWVAGTSHEQFPLVGLFEPFDGTPSAPEIHVEQQLMASTMMTMDATLDATFAK